MWTRANHLVSLDLGFSYLQHGGHDTCSIQGLGRSNGSDSAASTWKSYVNLSACYWGSDFQEVSETMPRKAPDASYALCLSLQR